MKSMTIIIILILFSILLLSVFLISSWSKANVITQLSSHWLHVVARRLNIGIALAVDFLPPLCKAWPAIPI